jgi:hypothetical protein
MGLSEVLAFFGFHFEFVQFQLLLALRAVNGQDVQLFSFNSFGSLLRKVRANF